MFKMKKRLRELKKWYQIVWKEETDYKIPLRKKILYAIKGFTVNEYIWYDLEKNDYRSYISEYERVESREINGKYKFILDDKIVFEEIFSEYARVPINYAWINNGEICGLHNYQVSNDNIIDFLFEVKKSMLKWTDQGGGLGTYAFFVEGDRISVNGKVWSNEDVLKLFSRKGSAILCEYIEQSKFSAEFFPDTTNTMRIVCAKMNKKKDAEIIIAIQRIGTEASIPVDNAHNGGLVCDIDMETGMIGYGIARLGKKENRMRPFYKHPDTGAIISGKYIPNWKELKTRIIELTNKLPYLRFVAWDVLLTEEGFCIIEGNASSGCRIFQLEKGLRDSKLGELYKSYGIIK